MALFRSLRTHLLVAPGTDVGKTVLTSALCRASINAGERVTYIKPIGTAEPGALRDDEFVAKYGSVFGRCAVDATCLYQFDQPVSPHLAARNADAPVPSDEEVVEVIRQHLEASADAYDGPATALVETAGGVHSPTLTGQSQLDAYRPLRLPTVLIASAQLGGISSTISAYESLLLRGYDVDAVLCFREEYYRNFEYFARFFGDRGIPTAFPLPPPSRHSSPHYDRAQMVNYFHGLDSSDPEHALSGSGLSQIVEALQAKHRARLADLESAGQRTMDCVWWPFVQHTHVKDPKDVMVIDSADGDNFRVLQHDATAASPVLAPMLDGSASWWSQGLGHANTELTLAAAYAAGRYGHVMFPTATHEPALKLAERLVYQVGAGWASRCFFSDDGSTAMEVGLKMALRLHNVRSGRQDRRPLGVLGLAGSYHGDTIGAMDASPGNVYNDRVDWYTGRGFWLDPPTVMLSNSKPVISFEGAQWSPSKPASTSYTSLAEVYDVETRLQSDPLAQTYSEHITRLIADTPVELGALVLEPVLMGAGGMLFVDPLFQRILIDVARSALSLPVIFDEVFTGMGRLGHYSAGPSLLGVQPDIAAYAKVLTGGLVPLSATLASDEVFEAFKGEQKVDALLHGHSYTAHPVGCAVANKALDLLEQLGVGSAITPTVTAWSTEWIERMSGHARVDGAMAFGTVLSLYLRDVDGQGYQSTAAASLLKRLRHPLPSSPHAAIHARPLGNVVYIIASLTSPSSTLRAIEAALEDGLDNAS